MNRSNLPIRRTVLVAGLALVIGLLMGCRGERRQPFLVVSGPTGMVSFQIAEEDGELLWSIAAAEPVTVTHIEYGTVPAGFHQVVPKDNEAPRPLIWGEWLKSAAICNEGTFYHEGFATGPGTFEPMTHSMALRQPDSRSPD